MSAFLELSCDKADSIANIVTVKLSQSVLLFLVMNPYCETYLRFICLVFMICHFKDWVRSEMIFEKYILSRLVLFPRNSLETHILHAKSSYYG